MLSQVSHSAQKTDQPPDVAWDQLRASIANKATDKELVASMKVILQQPSHEHFRSHESLYALKRSLLDGNLDDIQLLFRRRPQLLYAKLDETGNTVVHLAACIGVSSILDLVATMPCFSPYDHNRRGRTPIECAWHIHHTDVLWKIAVRLHDTLSLQRLMDLQPELLNTTIDGDGHTALHWSVLAHDQDMIDLLRESDGIDVSIQTKAGETAIDLEDRVQLVASDALPAEHNAQCLEIGKRDWANVQGLYKVQTAACFQPRTKYGRTMQRVMSQKHNLYRLRACFEPPRPSMITRQSPESGSLRALQQLHRRVRRSRAEYLSYASD
jgi:hypothetical protein